MDFDAVADEYDAARPLYPDEVFDALGPLEGLCVLDVGAGTGIATRALIDRRASPQRRPQTRQRARANASNEP
jgi:ubiquinone/menaquinone biosynthesis C-methylase UbiE